MENKELKDIRHFKGSLEDLEKYWSDRGVPMTPYKTVNYKYPKEITVKDDSVPRQTFRSYHDFVKTM